MYVKYKGIGKLDYGEVATIGNTSPCGLISLDAYPDGTFRVWARWRNHPDMVLHCGLEDVEEITEAEYLAAVRF